MKRSIMETEETLAESPDAPRLNDYVFKHVSFDLSHPPLEDVHIAPSAAVTTTDVKTVSEPLKGEKDPCCSAEA